MALADDFTDINEILSYLPGHIYWKNREGVYLGCNLNLAKLVNKTSPSEIIGKKIENLVEAQYASLVNEIDTKIMDEGREFAVEEEAFNDHGEWACYFTKKQPLHDRAGNVVGMLGVSLDITKRKLAEQEAIKAREKAEAANRAKTEFLANISHDVATPLISINILANQLLENPENKKNAELILFCQNQLSTFFKNCLDNANFELESPQLSEEIFSVTDFFEEIYNLFITNATHKKLLLNIHIDENAKVTVLGCRFILLRIVLNLVSNALKFTEAGGVTIEASASNSSNKNEILLTISVQDTGMGIPEEKQTHIFERLTRLAPAFSKRIEGSGIGLHIVDQYVKRIGGEIHLKSEVGAGSQFTVTVPLKIAMKERLR